MRKKHYIYCDMDGVLADFFGEKDCLLRWENEKGFFKGLKPIYKNVFAINQLIKNNDVSVFILSASKNHQSDKEKKEWLKQYLPNLKSKNIIFSRLQEPKKLYMRTKKGILFDDYGKNCKEWGEESVKVVDEMTIYNELKKRNLI